MAAKRNYSLTFQLFDVTLGEKAGDVLDQSAEPVIVSPLAAFESKWRKYCADAPVELSPPNIKAIRVALARNGGAAIMRRRFDFEGRKYLIQMRVEALAEVWRGVDAEGRPVTLYCGAGPVLEVAGEPVELTRAE